MPDPQPAPLEDLLSRAQNGDNAAYARLLQAIAPMLRGYVRNRLAGDADVEDVVQEILLSLHQARHTWRPGEPVKPWLFAIARYRVMDYLRSLYRKTARQSDVSLDDLPLEDTRTPDVTAQLIQNELVTKALAVLNERDRTIVTLMKVQGYSASEVALEMHMQVSAVKVAAHRAYQKMHKHLNDKGMSH